MSREYEIKAWITYQSLQVYTEQLVGNGDKFQFGIIVLPKLLTIAGVAVQGRSSSDWNRLESILTEFFEH